MTEEQINGILDAKRNYDAAKNRQMGVSVCRERLKNILFNSCNDLIPVIRGERVNIANEAKDREIAKLQHKIKELEMSVESLQNSLDDVDNENDDLKRQLKEALSAPKAKRQRKAVDMNVDQE